MQSLIENLTNIETKKQAFLVAPPPSLARKQKAPEDCYQSVIDQGKDGLYGSAKMVRSQPRTTSDTYFKFRPRKAKPTEMRSYRRNYSHRSVALFRTKAGGPTRGNIAYMTGSFLELDGSTDGTIKSLEDVLTLIKNNNLPTASDVIQTSKGHFHIIWTYDNPLPWTTKGESFWISQQKRYIELFQKAGFNVDVGASLNPCQFLRNPSQLQPFNFKRRCKVEIHKSYQKTSLRAIFRALNKTSIPNPRPMPASVKLRRYLRATETFTLTHKELAINLGIALSTAERIVKRAIANGDMFAVGKVGNNKAITRTTRYRSGLYIEAQFSEPSHSISKTNSVQAEVLLRVFKRKGTSVGRRQKTLFALGLFLKAQLGKRACLGVIRGELEGGAVRCHVSEKELERTLKNIMKPVYTNPFSLAKLRKWGLLEELKRLH